MSRLTAKGSVSLQPRHFPGTRSKRFPQVRLPRCRLQLPLCFSTDTAVSAGGSPPALTVRKGWTCVWGEQTNRRGE